MPGPHVIRLSIAFAIVYFVQGLAEPSTGLVSQPISAMLLGNGASTSDLAAFMALVSLPWSIKPLYGLVIDLVPLGASRHRSWLVLATMVAGLTTLVVALTGLEGGSMSRLLALMLIPTIAVAFADVAADALMVERGAPLGATGLLQSVQWSSLWASSILAGWLGGQLTAAHLPQASLLIVATLSLTSCALIVLALGDRTHIRAAGAPEPSARVVLSGLRSRRLLGATAFLFLLAFNPFASTIQYAYVVGPLGLSEEIYGSSQSVAAIASLIASATYGLYCRRLSPALRAHGSVLCAILATLPYAWVRDESTLMLASWVAAAAYATSTLVQLDLAAQVCPPAIAGTLFAVLMSVSNLGESLGTAVGGLLWDALDPILGAHMAYVTLVVLGALATALAWLALGMVLRPEPAARELV